MARQLKMYVGVLEPLKALLGSYEVSDTYATNLFKESSSTAGQGGHISFKQVWNPL